MGIEYELKFRADRRILEAVAKAYPEQHRHFDMQTTYYDTPSGDLSARHFTLRRRMENGVSVCTLKTPREDESRNELELPCSDIREAIVLFSQMGAPEELLSLTENGVTPVCSAAFHRIAIVLEFPDCTLELALDEGSLTGGDRSIPLCELEVELKSGSPLSAQVFAAELMERYRLVPEPRSKFRRALDLYQGGCL